MKDSEIWAFRVALMQERTKLVCARVEPGRVQDERKIVEDAIAKVDELLSKFPKSV